MFTLEDFRGAGFSPGWRPAPRKRTTALQDEQGKGLSPTNALDEAQRKEAHRGLLELFRAPDSRMTDVVGNPCGSRTMLISLSYDIH